ncbi:hypothetical protein Hanom_Chr12g01121361 [Helianthus anomalus]
MRKRINGANMHRSKRCAHNTKQQPQIRPILCTNRGSPRKLPLHPQPNTRPDPFGLPKLRPILIRAFIQWRQSLSSQSPVSQQLGPPAGPHRR